MTVANAVVAASRAASASQSDPSDTSRLAVSTSWQFGEQPGRRFAPRNPTLATPAWVQWREGSAPGVAAEDTDQVATAQVVDLSGRAKLDTIRPGSKLVKAGDSAETLYDTKVDVA